MPKLYLHMGFHKTGTTSFQETCKINQHILKKHDICYPLFNCQERPKFSNICNHSIPLFSMFTKAPQHYHINIKWRLKDIERNNLHYFEELKNALKTRQTVILSGEDISRLKLPELTNLKQFIKSYGYVIEPIVIIRSPYSFHCSSEQQRVKGGHYANFTQLNKQSPKIERLKLVFNNIRFYSFNTACSHEGGPVGFLLSLVKLDHSDFKIAKGNTGFSNAYIRTQNLLNQRNPRIVNGKINPNFIRLPEDTEDSKFYLTKDEFNTGFKKEYLGEEKYFIEHFGPQFSDKKVIYSKPLSPKEIIDILYPVLIN